MEWSSWLLQDHWRYFVGFLRQKFPERKELLELAHWEWVQAWIEIQPFEKSVSEKGRVSLNPSLQIVTLSAKNTVLNRDAGVYAFAFSETRGSVVERSLDLYEAHLIDLLQEDRKYSSLQLMQMAHISDEIDTPLSSLEWEKKFLSLRKDDIIYEDEGS